MQTEGKNDRLKNAEELAANGTKLLEEKKYKDAFDAFDRAALIYKKMGNHKEAAKNYASAATCWSIRSDEKIYFNTASRYQYAAEEAFRDRDYEYAKFLYHEAARFYEKDGSTKWLSLCFYMFKIAERNHYWNHFNKIKWVNFISKIKIFFALLWNIFLYIMWGYGERPHRTILFAFIIILFSTIIFSQCGILYVGAKNITHSFFDCFYFSIVTFTTLGYGDYQPIGVCRLVAVCEAFSALFIMPLFIVGLTRKYLRTYS